MSMKIPKTIKQIEKLPIPLQYAIGNHICLQLDKATYRWTDMPQMLKDYNKNMKDETKINI